MSQAPAKSATARYIDTLERRAKVARPLRSLSVGHVITGAVLGLGICFLLGVRALDAGRFNWWATILFCVLSGAGFGFLGRWFWNGVFISNVRELRALARQNLFDHDLLYLCMQDDLPAKFEVLRHVAQSYGKTRARNWAELKKGSMQQRVQWLVENYYVICSTLRLDSITARLQALQKRLLLWSLLPLGVFIASLIPVFMGTPPSQGYALPIVLGGMALALGGGGVLLSLVMLAGSLQQAAFLAELSGALDTDLLDEDEE